MFLFVFRSTKIGVCNKVNSEPAAFFAFFGVIPLVQEKILAHFGPPEPPPVQIWSPDQRGFNDTIEVTH